MNGYREETKAKEVVLKEYLRKNTDIEGIENLTEGKRYATYIGYTRKEVYNRTQGSMPVSYVILKELDEERCLVYEQNSKERNLYLETSYRVIDVEGTKYAMNECVNTPSMYYGIWHKASLSMQEYVECLQKKGAVHSLREEEALVFLYQICEGIKSLHKKQYFHGDLSPRNILFTDAIYTRNKFARIPGLHHQLMCKVIDFGNTKKNKEENHQVTTVIGTKEYAAPDIMDFQVPTNHRSDVYSLGCLLGYMLTGSSPKERNIQGVVSKEAWNIIKKCTAPYAERYSSVEILQKQILKVLGTQGTPGRSWLRAVPGFRSGNYLKMAIASYYYGSIVLGLIAATIAGAGYHVALTATVMIFCVIAIFDVFGIMERCKKHSYFLRTHGKTALVLRILIGVVLSVCYACFVGLFME